MGRARILVVEDDAIIVEKLKLTLKKLNHEVVSTSDNGLEAIEFAKRDDPDLVLMDIHLKGSLDGIQTTEEIRANKEVPVIFMTAYSDDEKIQRAKKTLPYGYLLKPVQDKALEINIEIALHTARVEAEKRFAEEERRKLQQQLFQAQKMESLGTLAGGIAHDFNNLLFQIMGSIQIAKKRIPESDRSIKNLSNALQAAYRAKDLVQQILTFSKKSKSERKPILIQPIIKEALKLLRSSLPATIEIQHDIDPAAGLIECDPTQVYQILMNLCTNAYHAMDQNGGVLQVTLKEIGEDSLLELTVKDTGQGMSSDTVDRIFEPYFTTKGTGEGTGLGLSIVHGIVSNYGGKIEVESSPGLGSLFRIRFPLTQEKLDSSDANSDMQNLPKGKERILVIDDEELIMKMEVEILESLGYEVEGFADSVEALKSFMEDPSRFDLVLTDQTMPDITGIDLAREILAVKKDIPIILLTGFSGGSSERRAKSAGIKRYLLKPLDMNKLAITMREVLDESQQS